MTEKGEDCPLSENGLAAVLAKGAGPFSAKPTAKARHAVHFLFREAADLIGCGDSSKTDFGLDTLLALLETFDDVDGEARRPRGDGSPRVVRGPRASDDVRGRGGAAGALDRGPPPRRRREGAIATSRSELRARLRLPPSAATGEATPRLAATRGPRGPRRRGGTRAGRRGAHGDQVAVDARSVPPVGRRVQGHALLRRAAVPPRAAARRGRRRLSREVSAGVSRREDGEAGRGRPVRNLHVQRRRRRRAQPQPPEATEGPALPRVREAAPNVFRLASTEYQRRGRGAARDPPPRKTSTQMAAAPPRPASVSAVAASAECRGRRDRPPRTKNANASAGTTTRIRFRRGRSCES